MATKKSIPSPLEFNCFGAVWPVIYPAIFRLKVYYKADFFFTDCKERPSVLLALLSFKIQIEFVNVLTSKRLLKF